jgi:four helix bundle protein
MTAHPIEHERIDVYRLSIEDVTRSFEMSQSLTGLHRHARNQWLRAAQSIPLNIAEGNDKRSLKDRARFLNIARGSALECAAIQDVLVTTKGIKVQDHVAMKAMLLPSRAQSMMLTSITITSTAALSTSTAALSRA